MKILNYGGVPIHLWANLENVEDQALQQLGNISRLPWWRSFTRSSKCYASKGNNGNKSD